MFGLDEFLLCEEVPRHYSLDSDDMGGVVSAAVHVFGLDPESMNALQTLERERRLPEMV